MSAVPTPRLDRVVMRALEVRAMTHEQLAHYLGIEPETLDYPVQRLTRSAQIERRGKMYWPKRRLTEMAPAPKPDPRFASNRAIGIIQRRIMADLQDAPCTVRELADSISARPQTVIDACLGLERRGLARMVEGKWEVRG